ncbi:hypothetical protein HNQ44_001918 [Planomicrobium koreense]|uniref:Uncharacterized protein n=1 Tax=Planococcus koreensis TaxID=112331 RepID=A0A7W8FUD5_9BACL|nr:hypothetical protein [Planococcus koreensis]
MAVVIDMIKEYLNMTTEQVLYVIDYLIKSNWVEFEDGKLIITADGGSILKSSKLNTFSLENINEFRYTVKDRFLETYIPKKF